MSVPITIKDPEIKSKEIDSWLRKHRLKKTQINITKATNALRAEKQEDALPAGKDVSYTGSDVPRQIIYGECKVGGTIVFLDSRANNQYIDIVIAIATHEINAVVDMYLDDCRVIFQSGSDGHSASLQKPDGTIIPALNKVFLRVATGADDQTAIGDLIGQNPAKWTEEHKLSGTAHAYVILVWDAYLFGDGIPDISFRVQGKLVYDPRTDSRRYTATAAICAADYITDATRGIGASYDLRIDEDNLIDAGDVCDELVDLQGGGQEYRYTVNGYFNTDETHGRVLERMAAAMGGHITYSNGKWKFWPAKWREPVLDLTEDDLRSSIRMQTLVNRDDIFNAVRGTFVDSTKGFIETDYPVVKNSSYAALDGEVLYENIDFHFVNTKQTCQRLAKLELERIRQGIQLELEVSPRAFEAQVPENITLTLERYGWTAKPFEIVKCDFIRRDVGDGAEIVVALALRETSEAVFNWDYWEETSGDAAPNTNLPSPFSVPVINGLALSSGTSDLYKRGDGTIAPRVKLSWTPLSDYFVSSGGFIEAQFKLSADSDYIDAPRIPGSSSSMYLTDIQDGAHYDIRVRAVNAFGTAGAWISVDDYFVIGKTAPPANVTGFAAIVSEYGIQFSWQPVADLDLKHYEIREGGDWATGLVVGEIKGTLLTLPVREKGLGYNFNIRAVDTSGNYSASVASVSVDIFGPSIASCSSSFNGPNLIIDWPEATLGSWAIDIYDVYYGDNFAGATFLLSTKSSIATVRVDWLGLRTFWIVARDIYGNASDPISVDAIVAAPNPVTTFSPNVVDNNVICRWSEPTISTLPIAKYLIKKGTTYAGAEEIGEILSTFTVIFELLADNYTYWIEAIDTAGNHSLPLGTTVAVNEPPDFQLIAAVTLTNGTTLLNCKEEPEGTIIAPINTTRSWQDHFLISGWSTPQDQIDAGFPIYIQPTREYGRWEKIHDLGTTVNNVLIHLVYTRTDIVTSVTVTKKIAYSTDGVSWTEEEDVAAVLALAVRYIRIRIDFGTVP